MTKYTPNLVKTDPPADIDTPSPAMTTARRAESDSTRIRPEPAFDLVLLSSYAEAKERRVEESCAFTSVCYKIFFFFVLVGGKRYPSVSKKTLQWNQEKCWYSRRGSPSCASPHKRGSITELCKG